jgi:hypothetical protein
MATDAPGRLPGRVRVTGTVDRFAATGADVDRVPTPLTITPTERGAGNGATITDAVVGGQRASIAWDAGQPLVLDGSGGIELRGVAVTGDGNGAWVDLGGATLPLAPGQYHVATPVGVGTDQIAEPSDSVDFTADAQTQITFQGHETIPVAYPLHLQGPGGVTLSGRMQAATARATRTVATIALAAAPFSVDLTRSPTTLTVRATLQGPVTAR